MGEPLPAAGEAVDYRCCRGSKRALPAYGFAGGEVGARQAPLGHSHPSLDYEHSPHQPACLDVPWCLCSPVVLSFLPLMLSKC